MTLEEAGTLPHRARVRLPDGRLGKVVLWRLDLGALGVQLDGRSDVQLVAAAELERRIQRRELR